MTELGFYCYEYEEDEVREFKPVDCAVCNGGPNGHTLMCAVLNVDGSVMELEAVKQYRESLK